MTPDVLAAALGCSEPVAATWLPHIAAACGRYEITTPQRLAAFLAQIGHESGGLRWVRELWGPTAAQQRYEGRADLGNTQPGDGRRYCGRGLIQVTGRSNYARVGLVLGVDFVSNPEALEQPQWAALSAAEYWACHGCNELADRGDFAAITRKINGGLNGQADRVQRWERAKGVLTITTEEATVPLPAIAAAVLPSIISSIPSLAKLFGSGSEVAERNVKAAETAITIVQEAVGAVNAQDAAEKIAADPQAAAVAAKAVADRWMELTEVGGGIVAAREANAAAVASGTNWLTSPAFLVSCALLPLVYFTVGVVLLREGFPAEVRAMVVAAVVSGILGAVTGYWLGTSFSSAKKDERK